MVVGCTFRGALYLENDDIGGRMMSETLFIYKYKLLHPPLAELAAGRAPERKSRDKPESTAST